MAARILSVLFQRLQPNRLRVVVAVVAVLVGSAIAAEGGLFAATTVAAPACGSTNVSITSLNGSVYYVDGSAGMDSQYVGFKVTNHGTAISSVWATLGNFRGQSSTLIDLNRNETAAHSLGSLGSGASATGYWYTSDSSPSTAATTNPQYQDLTIYSGNPAAGARPLCTYTNSFAAVQTPIAAQANKVTSVVYGSPVLGQTFSVQQQGTTGEISSGPSVDPGVFDMSPATSSSWAADDFQLQSASVSFCATAQPCNPNDPGATSFSDALHLPQMDTHGFSSQEHYTANFVFKVVGSPTSTTAASPNVNIASGTQVKHTAPPSGISGVPVPASGDEALGISAATPTLAYPGGTDIYTVAPSGTSGIVYQHFTVTMPAGAVDVPGTSTWGGQPISDPTVSGRTLRFDGPFTWDGSSTLQFKLNYPSSAGAGTLATSVTGLSGQSTIGSAPGSSTPASTSITISKAPVTITALDGTATQGRPFSYGYAASGLVTGETVSSFDTPPSCSSSYVPASSPAGQYAITCSSAADSDYSFTYTTGTLTVLSSSGPTLSYDLNGATGTSPETQTGTALPYTVAAGSGITRTGYAFTGWNTASDGSGTTYQPGDQFTDSTPTTLYAIWTAVSAPSVTVTFNGNGSTGGSMTAEAFTSGAAKPLTADAFTRTGFSFGGWSRVPNGAQLYADGQSIAPTGDLTLYAIWTQPVSVTYVDSFAPGGGSTCVVGATPSSSFTYPAGWATIGQPNVSGADALTSNGWGCNVSGNSGKYDVFAGWNTSSTATTATTTGWYLPGDGYSGSDPLTLYAIWYVNGSGAVTGDSFLNYNGEGGIGSPQAQDLAQTSPTNISSTAPTQAGYSFAGWCSISVSAGSPCAGTTYTGGGSFTFTTAKLYTIYAIWTTKTYTLSYDANGGTGTTPSSSSVTAASVGTVASGSGLTKSGATFVGWNTAADGSGVSYGPGNTFGTLANTTLYAQWATNYVVNYSGNGSTGGSPPATQVFSGGSVTVAGDSRLSRTGYTFDGWNTTQDGSGMTYPAASSYSTLANVTLYATWVPAGTHQVTYLGNGATSGSTPAPQSFSDGTSVTIANNNGGLALGGSTFAGWNTAPDGSGTSYASGAVFSTEKNLTLYAVWLPAGTYQVSYMPNNAWSGSAPAAQSFTWGPVTISSNTETLARTGYVFDGWNTAADGSGTSYPAGAVYSARANLTLYAHWVQIGSFEVAYSPNGANGGSAPATQTFSVLAATISPNTFTRTGYQFIGWNTKPDGSGTNYTPDDSFGEAANLNLYPQWLPDALHAVVYNSHGASSLVPTQTFGSGGSVTIASGNSLTLDGYVFSGWNTAADGSGTSYAAGATYSTEANVTLYAQFSAVPYVVTYDANGGTGAVAWQDFSMSSGDNVAAGSGLSKPGYTFVGWNTADDGSGTSYASGDSYDLPINLYLFAQWIQSSSDAVVYDADGGSGSTAMQTFTSGGSVTVDDGTGLSRPGYTFADWTTQPNGGGTAYGPGTANPTYSAAATLVLYAHWRAVSYTVSYDTNGGAGTVPATTTFTFTDPATIVNGPGLSKAGYTFGGWNTAADGTGQTYSAGDEYGLPYNVTLDALWAVVGDTVIFNANGGTGGMAEEHFTAGEPKALTPNAFTRAGSTLDSWNTASDGTGTSYTDQQSITISTGMTLYAIWDGVTDTVTYKSNDGSSTYSTANAADGSSVALPTTEPVRSGYSAFLGWASSPNATSATYAPGSDYTLSGSVTLYAVFSQQTITTSSTTTPTSTTPTPTSTTTPTPATTTNPTTKTTKTTTTTPNTTDAHAATVTVRFDARGGSAVPPVKGKVGSTINLPAQPTRAWYVFAGWFASPSSGSAVDSPYKLATSKTLYAHWNPVKDVPVSAGETISPNGAVKKVSTKIVHGSAIVGTASYGLRIATRGTRTTVSKAVITFVKGSKAAIGGYGFKPGSVVRIYLFSKRLLVGVARVHQDGTYSGRHAIPRGISDGGHMIETVGTIDNGETKTIAASVRVMSRSITMLVVPFDFNSSRLTPILQAQVVRAAKIIKQYQVRSLRLTGFTDPRGSGAYNLALSKRRAASVETFLLQELKALHYPVHRLRQLGLGKTEIVHARNGTVEDAASRRVAITLIVP